ncbi:serine/threonine-protein kinase [Micromonospora mirobrigensis]|uniref:non-specific serine/threonine protein kinase n=1 Tax=Micromonospora mirobrigensis TaxID=262898 RepID=A0A1C4ZNF4_9ACTN|nr:serine/threonine-protein kinase [Micromonospora mirobrigensis]SCF34523.1 Protein kinase domain-containing protein [Micromonospora mirobrigensis]
MTDTPPGALRLPIVPGLTDLEVFARGGYATVYRATQISVGREVAVKVENRTLDSERDQARFLREARAAGRMSSHPHVVDLFDVGVTVDQHPYLIMELCDGSYAERMRTSPLDAAEARDLGVKIADALAHSHAAGVLHRDVKPANILHSHFNPAVLADFGLAVLAEVRDASVTLEVLTPAYAPPEMFSHSPPSPAVDVYALCATLYAVMHGRPPRWQSERNPSLVTVLEMFHQPIPGLPGVPEELVDVLRAGMANDPEDRPSAVELRDLLAALPLAGPAHPISGAPISGVPTSGGPTFRPPTSGGPTHGARAHGTPASGATHGTRTSGWAGPRPPAEDGHPTVPTSGAGDQDRPPGEQRHRRWRRRWFLGTVGVLALAASASAGAWVASPAPPVTAPTPTARGAVTPSAGAGGLPGCGPAAVKLPAGASCAPGLECFGPVRVRGTQAEAARLPCDGRHTWETYAEGELSAALVGAAHATISADPTVRRVCSPATFRLTSGIGYPTGWRLEVLPPSGTDTDRTYRCLAGRGVDALESPTLTGR